MYLLLSKNNPYLEELNKNPQGQTLQKDFDGMEIDLKNRFKSKELDIKDNYIHIISSLIIIISEIICQIKMKIFLNLIFI